MQFFTLLLLIMMILCGLYAVLVDHTRSLLNYIDYRVLVRFLLLIVYVKFYLLLLLRYRVRRLDFFMLFIKYKLYNLFYFKI